MATGANTAGTDRATASAIYRLADAVVLFRRSAEVCYVGADPDLDRARDRPPPVDEVVACYLGLIREAVNFLAANPPTAGAELPDRLDRLLGAATAMRGRFEDAWYDADHLARLRRRQADSDASDGLCGGECDLAVLAGSPLAPPAWQPYQDVADRAAESLPPPLRPLFDLGRLLAAIEYPRPSDYDEAAGRFRAHDPVHVQGDLSPRVTALMRAFRSASRLLDGLPERFDGAQPSVAACRLHAAILARLKDVAGDEEPGLNASRVAVVHDDGPAPAPPRADVGLSVPPLEPGEDFEALLALKRRMDPDDTYVGQSLAALRLFREMDALNRLPDDPVTILGPSGAGKTLLARLLHGASARVKKPFLDLSADDLVGGDETIRRVRWAGHGKNSGVPGMDPRQAAEGWLQQAAGGTIFVDEFHNLDQASLNYLRKPLDRTREVTLALGVGEPFEPDVRLVFATYRPIEYLQDVRNIPEDAFRRLRNRFLTVPPLRERKEDIPLFVERFRGGCRPGECFSLALLYHDWEQGQVDGLITAIRTAVAGRDGRGTLRASDLRGLIPDGIVDRVAGMAEADVGRELYSYLTRVLVAQGFRHGSRGGLALQKRLAELLGTTEARVSTRLKELGLRAGDGAAGG